MTTQQQTLIDSFTSELESLNTQLAILTAQVASDAASYQGTIVGRDAQIADLQAQIANAGNMAGHTAEEWSGLSAQVGSLQTALDDANAATSAAVQALADLQARIDAAQQG